ncbi:hypothetical protein [Prevotella dentasini]|uniref:hypothetical protein n=1 Tax=Prevotella dentasini TaxID=589537 RepID=UPI000469ED4C|nr:hypothetical protein [Prevotella dentasini]
MRRFFHPVFPVLLCCLSVACSREKPVDHGAVAAQAARHYYEQLLAGKYETFFKGMNLPDTVPDSYRRQMLSNFEKFRLRHDTLHGGLRTVKVRKAEFSAKDSTASAFLVLGFRDSTVEQVVVPMVKRRRVWLMR